MDTDIILDRLFRPTRPVTVGGTALIVRALSGPEQEARNLFSTHAARLLEKELADSESDAYQYRLRLLDNLDVEQVTDFLKVSRGTEIRREVERANPPVYQPFPDNASEEERRAVLGAREEAEAKRVAKVDRLVAAQADEYAQKFLAGKNAGELMVLAKAQALQALLAERANNAYLHYTLYVAVSTAEGSPYFASAADAAATHRDVVYHLYRVAQEVNDINPLRLSGPSSTD